MTSKFVYVTYIRTTPAKLWDALLKPEFTKQYWFGVVLDSDWKVGSPWKMVFPDDAVRLLELEPRGEVLEVEPRKRLVIKWRSDFPEMKGEGDSRCTFDLSEAGEDMKLTITHEIERDNSKLIGAVSGGWPKILSGLKTLLETGAPLTGLTVRAASEPKEAAVGRAG